MFPILLQLGPVKLYTYGFMMALGFFIGISWSVKRAPRYKVSPDFMSNLCFILIISGILGGRATFLMVEESVSDLFSLKFFEVWKGGMVFYGGFLGAIIAAWIYSKKHGVNFFTVADIMSPGLALALALGRLGCLAAGCCFGKQCELPWAITFHNPSSLAPLLVQLHPTQIYEAIGALAITGILLLMERRQRFNGQIFIGFVFLYAILRPIIESFRGDSARGFVEFWGLYPNEWLSTSTFISFWMIGAGIILFAWLRKIPSPRKEQNP